MWRRTKTFAESEEELSRVPQKDVDIGRFKMCHIKMYHRDILKEKEKSMLSQKEGRR